MAIEAVEGVTTIELSVAAVAVAAAVPLVEPIVALIVAVPGDTPAARPVPLTLATLLALEPHVAWAVTSLLVPSL